MPFDKGALGQQTEDQWSDRRRKEGVVLFPAAICENNTGKRGAPSLLVGSHAIAVSKQERDAAVPRGTQARLF